MVTTERTPGVENKENSSIAPQIQDVAAGIRSDMYMIINVHIPL